MPNIRVLRDMKARELVKANELIRRAYLYVARNESLPPQVRHQAQLQLNTFGRYTRPTTVKNRCSESGRGRGIMSEFALCRVRHWSPVLSLGSTYQAQVSIQTESIEQRNPWSSQGFVVEVYKPLEDHIYTSLDRKPRIYIHIHYSALSNVQHMLVVTQEIHLARRCLPS